MIQQVGSAFITFMLAKFIMNDLPHAVGLTANPGNPNTSDTTYDIIRRAGLKEYEYVWFPAPAEERLGRVYPYTRTRNISVYTIRMTRTGDNCQIKLYENLEGWKRKLRATWSGIGKVECDRKFEDISETVRQVVFEYKVSLIRRRG